MRYQSIVQIFVTESMNLLHPDNLLRIKINKLGREVIFCDEWITGIVLFPDRNSLYYFWKLEFRHLYY
jgi:hypothetical protein